MRRRQGCLESASAIAAATLRKPLAASAAPASDVLVPQEVCLPLDVLLLRLLDLLCWDFQDLRRDRLRAVTLFDWVPEQSPVGELLNGILTRMPGPLRLEDSPSLGIVREHRG